MPSATRKNIVRAFEDLIKARLIEILENNELDLSESEKKTITEINTSLAAQNIKGRRAADPNAPKPPMNAFRRFSNDVFAIGKGEEPSDIFPDHVRPTMKKRKGKKVYVYKGDQLDNGISCASILWKDTTEEEKGRYKELYEKDREVWQKQSKKYKDSLNAGKKPAKKAAKKPSKKNKLSDDDESSSDSDDEPPKKAAKKPAKKAAKKPAKKAGKKESSDSEDSDEDDKKKADTKKVDVDSDESDDSDSEHEKKKPAPKKPSKKEDSSSDSD